MSPMEVVSCFCLPLILVYIQWLQTLVISQRSQIMSLSVDHHYKNNSHLYFLIIWDCRDLLELQRSVKLLKGCNLWIFPISPATWIRTITSATWDQHYLQGFWKSKKILIFFIILEVASVPEVKYLLSWDTSKIISRPILSPIGKIWSSLGQ